MPKLRRRIVLRSWDCVACQFCRRASRGWVEDGVGVFDVGVVECEVRSLSGIPGAEGAPGERVDVEGEEVNLEIWVFVVEVGWWGEGVILRD